MIWLQPAPFDIKAWSVALPVSVVAIGALVVLGVWTAKQLKPLFGNGKTNGNGASQESGKLSPTEWELRIGRVVSEVVEHKIEEHLEKLRSTNHDINNHLQELTALLTLLRQDLRGGKV